MTATVFLEDACQAVLATLQAQLPAALSATWAKYAAFDAAHGVVPLPSSLAFHYGERAGPGTDLPYVTVYPLEATLEEPGPGDSTGAWAVYRLLCAVEFGVVSDAADVVERQFARLAEALWTVLYTNQTEAGLLVATLPRRLRRLATPRGEGFDRIGIWETLLTIYPSA